MSMDPSNQSQPNPQSQSAVVVQPREGMGRIFGRTVIQALVWSSAVAMVLLALTFGTFILFAGFVSVIAGGDSEADNYEYVYGDDSSSRKLLAIPISGLILGEAPSDGGGGLFAPSDVTYGYDVKQQLVDAIDQDEFSGIILVMDTPGGTIYGSQAINDGVKAYIAATGKPVLAWVSSISASGGMLGMAPATRIVADHGTLIGSIGVRFGPFEFYDKVKSVDGPFFSGGVDTFNGITYTEITAGRGKDEGSPYRPLTDEEKANFQRGVDNAYASFVDQVSEGRKIAPDVIRNQLGALIYDELTARDLKLIDGIASREEAFREAADLAKLRGGDWQVVREKSPSGGLFGLFGKTTSPPAGTATAAQPLAACVSRRAPMAYYGSLAALCQR